MLTIEQAIKIANVYSRCPVGMRSRLDYIFSKCEDFNFDEYRNFDFKDADDGLMNFIENNYEINESGRISKTIFEEDFMANAKIKIMRKDIKWHMRQLGFLMKKINGYNFYFGICERKGAE